MFDPFSGLLNFGKRYDVHKSVAYIMTTLQRFTAEMICQNYLYVILCSCIIEFYKLVAKKI